MFRVHQCQHEIVFMMLRIYIPSLNVKLAQKKNRCTTHKNYLNINLTLLVTNE